MQLRPAFIVAALSFVTDWCAQSAELNWQDFDKDKSGKLEWGTDGRLGEADIYLLHKTQPTFVAMDADRNGIIDPAEQKAAADKFNRTAPELARSNRKFATNNAFALGIPMDEDLTGAQADQLLREPGARPKYTPNWFRLRGKVSEFGKAPAGGVIDNINPAIFSWGRNYASDTETWNGRGAIGGFWETSRADFALGVDFDRSDTDEPGKKDTDALIFRGLASGEPGGWNKCGMKALTFRGGLDYGTTFDFDAGILGAGLEIEPVWRMKAFRGIQLLFGKHKGRNTLNSPCFSLNNYLRIEGGGTVDDSLESVPADDRYLRIGPQVELAFWPAGTDFPISLTSSYGYYLELITGGNDYRNFRGGIDWRLDQIGHFSLRLEYVDGVTPLFLQRQKGLSVALSSRF